MNILLRLIARNEYLLFHALIHIKLYHFFLFAFKIIFAFPLRSSNNGMNEHNEPLKIKDRFQLPFLSRAFILGECLISLLPGICSIVTNTQGKMCRKAEPREMESTIEDSKGEGEP